MDLRDVQELAAAEMRRAGLEGTWVYRWDHARRRAGTCRYATNTITLSKPLMALYERAEVLEVIRHELAHAIVGPGHGHDAVWRAMARSLGAKGTTRLSDSLPKPPPNWVGTCPNGHTFERYRRPSTTNSCSRCNRRFDPRYVIAWQRAA
ncbi:MAG TPA: sprT domain-containing protein [Actinomycetales bacterium]|nr:sprT domain-containing protein [Actinomycetales bacterium]